MGTMKRNPMIVRRSMRFGNNYIFQKSLKNGQIMEYQSELEYLASLPFETDGDVLSIKMYPQIADILKDEDMIDEEIPNGYLDMEISWRGGKIDYVKINRRWKAVA